MRASEERGSLQEKRDTNAQITSKRSPRMCLFCVNARSKSRFTHDWDAFFFSSAPQMSFSGSLFQFDTAQRAANAIEARPRVQIPAQRANSTTHAQRKVSLRCQLTCDSLRILGFPARLRSMRIQALCVAFSSVKKKMQRKRKG